MCCSNICFYIRAAYINLKRAQQLPAAQCFCRSDLCRFGCLAARSREMSSLPECRRAWYTELYRVDADVARSRQLNSWLEHRKACDDELYTFEQYVEYFDTAALKCWLDSEPQNNASSGPQANVNDRAVQSVSSSVTSQPSPAADAARSISSQI